MNGNLPAVAKAMILASLPLCALMMGCGGDDDSSGIEFDASELSRGGIEIVGDANCRPGTIEPSPCGTGAEEVIGIQEATASLGQGAPDVLQGELVQLRLSNTPHIVWGRSGEFQAWALELDPRDDDILSHFETTDCNGLPYPRSPGGLAHVIVFVDATDGGCLAISAMQGAEGGDS